MKKNETTETVVEENPETVTEENPETVDNGMVEIRLFKDNDKYKNPLFVAVNGKAYMVERGKRVEVPKEVAEVIENSEIQLEYADRVMENAVHIE